MERTHLRGPNLLLLLGLGLLWGVAFVFITTGLESFSPILFAALRFDIAGLALLAVALARRVDLWPRSRAQWTAILIAAVLNVGCYHAFLFWGQQWTTPAVAAVIVGLNPILTTLAARAFLTDESVGWGGLLGLALGLAGVVLLATLKPGDPFDAQGIGELLVVAAIASWAIGSTLVRRTKHAMDVFAFTAWQMLVGAIFLHLAALVLEGGGHARFDFDGTVALLYLALVSSSLGFVIYFTIMERVGPIRANLVSHIAPVFATLTSVLFLDMAFELRALLAFAFIAGGFGLVARPSPGPSPKV